MNKEENEKYQAFGKLVSLVDTLKVEVERLSEIVRDGNGQPPLLSKVAVLQNTVENLEESITKLEDLTDNIQVVRLKELDNQITEIRTKLLELHNLMQEIKDKQEKEKQEKGANKREKDNRVTNWKIALFIAITTLFTSSIATAITLTLEFHYRLR